MRRYRGDVNAFAIDGRTRVAPPCTMSGRRPILEDMPKAVKKKAVEAPYPSAPRIVGVDWLELPVRWPTRSARLYRAIGLVPRTTVGRKPRLAVGGVELLLCRTKHDAAADTTSPKIAPKTSGVRIQMVVDDVDAKRRELIELGLEPGRVKRRPRGDRMFEWRDPDGHVFCFVGPARRADDRSLG